MLRESLYCFKATLGKGYSPPLWNIPGILGPKQIVIFIPIGLGLLQANSDQLNIHPLTKKALSEESSMDWSKALKTYRKLCIYNEVILKDALGDFFICILKCFQI